MKTMQKLHTFHVPVMGTGFSIDTPIKIAHYGISSVISLVDDALIEEMRKIYCEKVGEEYVPITKYEDDYRARRITAYLNLVDRIVHQKFEDLKRSAFEAGSEITKYFELLPDTCLLKRLYCVMLKIKNPTFRNDLQACLRNMIEPGDINVNIMTKLDRANYDQHGKELSSEYSDALSALRGYAKSTLESAIVFSAGINRRLYSYVEQFADFFADAKGFIKKRITLKVTDYRSSIIQGKFFAKKGLWISEFRVESGLNCGGHVFPSDGFLMGPILEEFKNKRTEIIRELHEMCNQALRSKGFPTFSTPHPMAITAQGGIGTINEQNFLLNYYKLDRTGWATPFLLVPEVTNVDPETLKKLAAATEKDLYVSDVSPIGIQFNNLRGSLSDTEKEKRVEKGRPGSACPKSFLVSNTEFTEKPICTASRQYQKLKIEQLQKLNLAAKAFKEQFDRIVQKACICTDLGEPALIKNNVPSPIERFSAVCPGPNLAYFSKISTLADMVSHIYGRVNLLNPIYRPHMFIKELKMYVEYFTKEVKKTMEPTERQIEYLNQFKSNLLDGMNYYRELFPKMAAETEEFRQNCLVELETFRKKLEEFIDENRHIFPVSLPAFAAV